MSQPPSQIPLEPRQPDSSQGSPAPRSATPQPASTTGDSSGPHTPDRSPVRGHTQSASSLQNQNASRTPHGTPRHVKVSTNGARLGPENRPGHTDAVEREMKSSWGFIRDNDEWDRVCHQTQLPVSPEILADVGDFSNVPHKQRDEYKYYNPLCTTVNNLLERCAPNYTMRITGLNQEPGSHHDGDMKPDLCMYEDIKPARDAFTLPDDGDATGADQPPKVVVEAIKPWQARTAWAWMTMLVEVKHKKSAAPYNVGKDGKLVLPITQEATDTRVQIAKYAAEALLRQHRTFFFTAVIANSKAYLMRWDRAGVIVTTPFDYTKEPTKLLRFFYRIATADRSLQGYDPTVSLASDQEVQLYQAHLDSLPATNVYLHSYVAKSLQKKIYYPVYQVKCPISPLPTRNPTSFKSPTPYNPGAAGTSFNPVSGANPASQFQTFLIGRHHHGTRSPTGRGGKGFVAYDTEKRRSVFLKDYWYADHATVHPETEVYQKLMEKDVKYVATLLAGGDVTDSSGIQETLSQQYVQGKPEKIPAKRRHHRLVVKEIGRPLESYSHGGELIQFLHQALLGHKDAYEKAGILHRDVSMANILIDLETRKAFLNDWDLCKYVGELNLGASQHGRSGTWPYMSATLVYYPRKPNELADDIESFLHIFTIAILRFHKHSLTTAGGPNEGLTDHVKSVYFGTQHTTDGFCVGPTKLYRVRNGDPGFALLNPKSKLTVLLARLFQLAKSHYAMLKFDDLLRKWGSVDYQNVQVDPADEEVQISLDDWTGTTPDPAAPPTTHITTGTEGPALLPALISADQLPSPNFNTHFYFLHAIQSVVDDKESKLTLDKVDDQFENLGSFFGARMPTSSRGSKRLSQPNGLGSSGTGSVSKRARNSNHVIAASKDSLHVVHEIDDH